MDWITIEAEKPSPTRRTQVWRVLEKQRGFELGRIAWFNSWRRYAFYPFHSTVYEEKCLRDIADFCERQTREHKPQTPAARLKAKETAMGR